jgi:hypothetical protein
MRLTVRSASRSWTERVGRLAEQIRLLQTERYAPKIDRIFDDADQGARPTDSFGCAAQDD